MNYTTYMTTQKPQVLLTFTDESLLNKIDDYRFDNRINTRSEAIRQLIEIGLKQDQTKTKKTKRRV